MNTSPPPKYLVSGIVDKKQAEIVQLTNQVTEAQFNVAQLQVIVNSLTAKSTQFSLYLTQADGDLATALANLNLGKNSSAAVRGLVQTLGLTLNQTSAAQAASGKVTQETAVLINKLIFTVEIINKLAQLINKQKANNPLVPDSLIGFMAQANTDANNAIALLLTALQSCYAAQASLMQSKTVVSLGKDQGTALQRRMLENLDERTQKLVSLEVPLGLTDECNGIMALLQHAYQLANERYQDALWSNNSVTDQLNFAQVKLADAITTLNSYKAGLAAATAAAYAA
ncbi:hypothetical protein [Herbaspirillum rubrisubalbicans]|uniref:Uncharacterized protein n=1 Tax=Herbaspirillum rubrisubalbicans Os34 TaxID=1235827 RepID=A0A6M3ZRA6_9BURK|nr:hypothetical protein [Herbaspirillum rubrisubalbicans]QJQ01127.1 hypothetical protein C798_13055 [Herbaspirillum rubrisubalbicans Os34]